MYVPIGVARNRVPPLVLIDVNTLNVSLCVNVIRAAGQALEKAPSIASSVKPGSVVVADAPHYPQAVTLHQTQVASNLPPEPAQINQRLMAKSNHVFSN